MWLFLLIYFSLYGGMNAYVLRKLCVGLGGPVWRWAIVAVLLLCLVLLPMLMHHVEGRLPYPAIRGLAVIGYTWMAVAFWFACVCAAADLWNAGLWLAARLRPAAAVWALTPRRIVLSATVLVTLACIAGAFEAGAVRVREVTIATGKLPPDTKPLRLLVIADLHLGRTGRADILQRTLALAREANADVIVSLGDFVDAVDEPLLPIVAQFTDLQAPLGKFAVTGNHEFYPGIERTTHLHEIAAFTLLRGSTRKLTEHLRLVGVDDAAVAEIGKGQRPDEDALLPTPEPDIFTVLLKHRPATTAAARERCDLQVSGHTHKGQIFPFGIFVRLFHPYPHGRLLHLPEGLRVYVSPGTGTWGPPLRLFARPEVTVFTIAPCA